MFPKSVQNGPRNGPEMGSKMRRNYTQKWIHLGDPTKAPSQNVPRLSRDCPATACDFHDSPWEPFLGQRAARHQQWSLRGDAVDVEVFAWANCHIATQRQDVNPCPCGHHSSVIPQRSSGNWVIVPMHFDNFSSHFMCNCEHISGFLTKEAGPHC